MESSVYEVETNLEDYHWWFRVRRSLFAKELALAGFTPDQRILDIGTSTGTNLRLLRDLGCGDATGIDYSPEAIEHCLSKGFTAICRGDICALPFNDSTFDLVMATDILEHVDEDAMALAEIKRVLKPGGRVLITVPAFQSLWGRQDEVSHHKRRYLMPRLLALIEAAGLSVAKHYYFNYLLFVPIFIARMAMRLFRIRPDSENAINAPILNTILKAIFYFDVATARRLQPPFGVSILALANKPLKELARVPDIAPPPAQKCELDLLRCPVSEGVLRANDMYLYSSEGDTRYRLNAAGVPLFAESAHSDDRGQSNQSMAGS